MCTNSRPYAVGDVVYYVYNLSGSFPVFYQVTAVTKCCIKVRPLEKKYINVSCGFGSFGCVPDMETPVKAYKRGGLLRVMPDGFARVSYYSYKFALRHWDGRPVSGFCA